MHQIALVDVGIVSTCTVSTYGFYFSHWRNGQIPFAWSFETSGSDYTSGALRNDTYERLTWTIEGSFCLHDTTSKAISPAEYTDSWNISTAAKMIRGTVVRRRSPLSPWIWERHLKQHRCRRWVTRAFLLFLASCFHQRQVCKPMNLI